MQALIITLPLIWVGRIGTAIKLSDIVLFGIVVYSGISGRLKINQYVWLLILYFLVFATFGYFRINNFDIITVKGGWDTGLLSSAVYPWVAFIQTTLYILGGMAAAKAIFNPKLDLIRFLAQYFVIWSLVCIILSFLPGTKELMTTYDIASSYLRGTFTEKGPMSSFVVFVFSLVITAQDIPNIRKLSRWEMPVFVLVSIIDIVMCKADRGTIAFVLFNLCLLISRRPQQALKLLPVAVVVTVAIIPLLLGTIDKAQLYFKIVGVDRNTQAIGRYAGAILLPIILPSAPFFGIGYGNYIFYRTSSQYAPFLPIVPKDEPESSLVQMLIETGGVGFLLYITLVVGVPVYRILKAKNKIAWPFVGAFLVYISAETTTYYLLWLWLFFVLRAIALTNPKKPTAYRLNPAQYWTEYYRKSLLTDHAQSHEAETVA